MAQVYGIGPVGLAKIAANNLRINWLRSFLTILGMVFGTAAVIATLSSNEGSKQFIQKELTKLGTNILSVDSQETALKDSDIAMISKYSTLFDSLSLVQQVGAKLFRYRASFSTPVIIGVTPAYFGEMRLKVASGRPFECARM